MADRVHHYVMGMDHYLVNSCMAMSSQPHMDIARVQAYEQGYPSQPAQSAPPQFTEKRLDSTGSSCHLRLAFSWCSHCGRSHFGECHYDIGDCFTYGRQGHMMSECPFRGSLGDVAQPIGSVSSYSSVAMRPMGQGIYTSASHGRCRGGSSSSSSPSNRIYALTSK
ncbi:uncharacterized protein LOC129892266 [Solanum dulcamara]|uniref:uncharacterized protein LOC129892266 n=1 Tax=Solanum dulcamara TaxID=45834 RepID=UPI002486AB4B|nr:uncharacterized protein LOC129892266 [Solanum dulcamara]